MIKKLKLYGPFLLGLALLLIISFFLPQILFQIQDDYGFNGNTTAVWEKTEKGFGTAEYEKNMGKRLERLISKKTEELTVSAINYNGKNMDEVVALLERAFVSDWMGMVNEMTAGLYYNFLQETSTVNIQDCKKYVVYENSSLENILLMVWYLDIYVLEEETTVRLLLDSETEEVYYLQIIGEESRENANKQLYKEGAYKEKSAWEYNDFFTEFFSKYYDGERNIMKELSSGEKYETDKQLCFTLFYGDVSTDFEVQMQTGKNDFPNFRCGISYIYNLIPEMIQN